MGNLDAENLQKNELDRVECLENYTLKPFGIFSEGDPQHLQLYINCTPSWMFFISSKELFGSRKAERTDMLQPNRQLHVQS